MTTIESQLSGALTDLMRAACVRNAEDTTIALRRILDLEQQLGVESPKMLRHYLERRSYEKALEFLKSGRPETETPRCAG